MNMKKLFLILTVLAVLGTSCEKFLGVDETNPNQASAVPASLVMPAALNNTAILTVTPGNYAFIYEWHGCWAISGGYSQDANMTQYNILNSHFQNNWANSYLNIQNYDYIIQNSTTSKQKPWRAMAEIMKAYVFQYLVDCWGNVPYSEANMADKGILKPKYDDQKVVYEDLVARLDTAMNLIATMPADAEEPGDNDIIYHGDMTLWAKFANTLKLRILMNQSDMADRASYISTNIATTASVGYLAAGEGAMSNPGYVQSTGKMNPFWERFYKQDGSQQADGLGYFVPNQDACDFLNANSDPRRLRFFAAYSGTLIQGNYFGAALLNLPSVTSKLGPGLLQAYNQSSPIMSDFEALFIQAEAAQRGFITGDAKALYESAVTQSILYMGGAQGTEADAATYLAQAKANVSFDASPDKIKAIITQKWMALNGIAAMPIWDDYRRTGFPDFIHFSQDPARLSDTPPVRLLYPQYEINTNNDNVILQGTINQFTSKIFWQNR
jgi:hypothetical protein